MLSLHSLFLQSFLKLGMGGTSPPAGAYCNQKKKKIMSFRFMCPLVRLQCRLRNKPREPPRFSLGKTSKPHTTPVYADEALMSCSVQPGPTRHEVVIPRWPLKMRKHMKATDDCDLNDFWSPKKKNHEKNTQL